MMPTNTNGGRFIAVEVEGKRYIGWLWQSDGHIQYWGGPYATPAQAYEMLSMLNASSINPYPRDPRNFGEAIGVGPIELKRQPYFWEVDSNGD